MKKTTRTKRSNPSDAPRQSPAATDPRDERRSAGPKASFPIVGVGASAGGLEAFTQLLKALPLDTGMGFVLVQHLDPHHDSALTQILSRATSLPVHEITDNQPVEPNHVYVIPRDRSLGIAAGVLQLEQRERTRVPHRPIDSFFESLAQDRHDQAIGVVLSGTATDGTLGLEAIKAEGGITFAQDESASYDSMPRSAVAAGCVDLVLAPAEIAQELARIARHPYVAGQSRQLSPQETPEEGRAEAGDDLAEDDRGSDARGEAERAQATAHQDDDTPLPSGGPPGPAPGTDGKKTPGKNGKRAQSEAAEPGAQRDDNDYKKILLLLRNQSGVDFSLYKSTTIQRRINRRMILTKHDTPGDYAGFLRRNPKELETLYSDVLISVTSFFRNPEMFDALRHKVLPDLLKRGGGEGGDDPLRCWVLGCSTGQEAYSIAMTFMEAAEKAPRGRMLQIFATDLNDTLLEKARHGLYAKSLADEIAPERLRRFFVEEQGGYRVNKALREMIVFARQNLIADPPFSRMDLVSCRNLLIYLEPSLQKKAMPTFHYALRPGGFLLLGASESISGFIDLFEPVDKKHKIFARKPAPAPAFHLPAPRARGEQPRGARAPSLVMPPSAPEPPERLRDELNAQREADRITINRFAPPGVLVSPDLQVLQFRGPTGAYLEPPAGKASFDVLKMAREGLMLPLRAAIHQARQENKPVRRESVRIKRNGSSRTVHLEVIPLKNLPDRCFLILFEDAPGRAPGKGARAPTIEQPPLPEVSKEEEPSRIAELETDLSETREYLQSMQEQHEAANEELQAANEEVQSANEELQSINEELETSKEELESSNEELSTVNEEMGNRNTELNHLNDDLVNLQTSTKMAIVLLGRDLAIRRFSPEAQKQFGLLATDLGRPIGHIRHGLRCDPLPTPPPLSGEQAEGSPCDLERTAGQVIADVREQELEVCDKATGAGGGERRWYSLRVRPYMTLDNKVDGAVLVLMDITDRKRVEDVMRESEARYRTLFDLGPVAVYSCDASGVIQNFNRRAADLWGRAPAQGDTDERFCGSFKMFRSDGTFMPHDQCPMAEVLSGAIPHFDNGEVHIERPDGSRVVVIVTIRPLKNEQGELTGAINCFYDITERQRMEEAVGESEARYRNLFNSMDEGYCIIEMIFDKREKPVDYRFLEVNPAFEKQAGMHDAPGKRMLEFVPEIEEHWLTNYGDVALTGEPIRFANEYKSLGRWFDVYAFRVGGPEIRKVAVLFTDITEHKKNEAALKASDRNKSEFLGTLAHELRNPLAPISHALELLKTAAGDGDRVEQLRVMMSGQVKQIVRIIDDLMNISRINRGKLALQTERMDLNEVIDAARLAASPGMEEAGQELIVHQADEPLVLEADPARLIQVLTNLLNNACKYSPAGGRIWLSARREQGRAVVRVRDEGMGIPADKLSVIFEMFSQLDDSAQLGRGGLGVGLALAASLVEMHGGGIEAHSDGPGKGSEFVVRLPRLIEDHAEAPTHSPEAEPSSTTGYRILLVEDHPVVAHLFAMILREMGHQVRAAADGAAALKQVETEKPEVVFSDISMPGMSGYDLAQRLRAQPACKDLILVASSGYGQTEDRERALKAGFDHYLVKPVEMEKLQALFTSIAVNRGPNQRP